MLTNLARVFTVEDARTVGDVKIGKLTKECGVVSATQQPPSVDTLQAFFNQTVEYKEVNNQTEMSR